MKSTIVLLQGSLFNFFCISSAYKPLSPKLPLMQSSSIQRQGRKSREYELTRVRTFHGSSDPRRWLVSFVSSPVVYTSFLASHLFRAYSLAKDPRKCRKASRATWFTRRRIKWKRATVGWILFARNCRKGAEKLRKPAEDEAFTPEKFRLKNENQKKLLKSSPILYRNNYNITILKRIRSKVHYYHIWNSSYKNLTRAWMDSQKTSILFI